MNLVSMVILCTAALALISCTPSNDFSNLAQNISDSIRETCKIENNLECYGDCHDGFSSWCYFDSREYKRDDLQAGFSFPDETKEACQAIHSTSVCGTCSNTFELRKEGLLQKVLCEEFFQAIESKNKECNDCLETINAGCC